MLIVRDDAEDSELLDLQDKITSAFFNEKIEHWPHVRFRTAIEEEELRKENGTS